MRMRGLLALTGFVFAAAAGEILPSVMHGASPWATAIGGSLGVVVMLLVKRLESVVKGPVGLLTMVGVDVLIDGLVLGIAFAAGAKAGRSAPVPVPASTRARTCGSMPATSRARRPSRSSPARSRSQAGATRA